MQHTRLFDQPCPIARALDIVGEWWTLLIIRDALLGARRFEDFKATGMADNILSTRLKKLVEEGIFERWPYDVSRKRFEYHLTEKGRGLVPVIASLRGWGQLWTEGPDRSPLTHGASGHQVSVRMYCADCDRTLDAEEMEVTRQKPTVMVG
jgi:DNA-binding HxlR family transcriptional regulator